MPADFRGLKEVLKVVCSFENGHQCQTGLRDHKELTLLFHAKAASGVLCIGMPAIPCGVTRDGTRTWQTHVAVH